MNFLQASAGRLPVTKPCISNQRWRSVGRLPVQHCTHVRITTCTITFKSDYSPTGTGIHDHSVCNPRLLLFATQGNTLNLGQYVQPQTVHKGDHHTWSLCKPVLVISAHFMLSSEASQLYRWLILSFSCLKPNYSSLTVYRYTWHLRPAPTVSTTSGNPELNRWTLPL